MKVNINNKTVLSNIFYLILGLCIILWTFWRRFIRIRLPKTLDNFNNSYAIFFIIITILLLIITIIITLREKINHKKNIEADVGLMIYFMKFNLIQIISEYIFKVSEAISQAPKKVYELLIFEYFNVSRILEIPFVKLSRFIQEFPIKYPFILACIHMIFQTMPKIIPPIIFIIDIFYFQQINYFYKSLLLYSIPLIYNVLAWILGHLADHNTYYMSAHLDFRDDDTIVFRKEIPPIEGAEDIISRKFDQALLNWFVDAYYIYVDIKWLVYSLDLTKQKVKGFERLFSCSLYLMGWLYILINIYYNIYPECIIIMWPCKDPFSEIFI